MIVTVWTEITDFFTQVLDWAQANPVIVFWTILVPLILIPFLKWLFKTPLSLVKAVKNPYDAFLRRKSTLTALGKYKKILEAKHLKISHSWMKDEQTLNDILVDVEVEVAGRKARKVNIRDFIQENLKSGKAFRVTMTGGPGSGKTMGMKVLATKIWNWQQRREQEQKLVPVLLIFAEIVEAKDIAQMKAKIVANLNELHFVPDAQKRQQSIEEFVTEKLESGELLLLIDGFDELQVEKRAKTAKLTNDFLRHYAKISAVLSSRTAVYEREEPFRELNPQRVKMAAFTPLAILRFLSQWQFEKGKSGQKLNSLIQERAHLKELASNPLMLTIIAFLYSQRKYTLPDNRVGFYEECASALLEKWDTAKKVEQSNRYQRHHKMDVLSRLAFEQTSEGTGYDKEIEERKVFVSTQEEMQRIGLKKADYKEMVDEIVFKSGLLRSLPPNAYRFPHRTFMEFFTAYYLINQKELSDVLALYSEDPKRWQEVLLLYCGLNKNKEAAKLILQTLLDDFLQSWSEKQEVRPLVFNALMESASPSPNMAAEILHTAEDFLLNHQFNPQIVEDLGFIAANPQWAHSTQAKNILKKLLQSSNDNRANTEAVLLALANIRDGSVDDLLLENLDKIDIYELITKMGEKGSLFVQRLFATKLTMKQKQKIIEGLKEAGNFVVLGKLVVESRHEQIQKKAALALVNMSKLEGFFEFLDSGKVHFELLDKKNRATIEAKYEEWTWHWDFPSTENGKKLAVGICYFVSRWYVEDEKLKEIPKEFLEEGNNWFRFLVTAFCKKDGVKVIENDAIGLGSTKSIYLGKKHKIFISLNGLKRHWKTKINVKHFRYIDTYVYYTRVLPVLSLISFIFMFTFVVCINQDILVIFKSLFMWLFIIPAFLLILIFFCMIYDYAQANHAILFNRNIININNFLTNNDFNYELDWFLKKYDILTAIKVSNK